MIILQNAVTWFITKIFFDNNSKTQKYEISFYLALI